MAKGRVEGYGDEVFGRRAVGDAADVADGGEG